MTSGKTAVYLNADVTTLDAATPHARGLVVENGKVARLLDGRPSGLSKEVEVVDCAGAAIVPGFHDCHVHLTDTGLLAGDHDFADCPDIAAMLKRVATLGDEILFAGNYEDQHIAEHRPPTMDELDSVAPDRPVLLTRIDGHSCVVNAAALKLIGVEHLEGVERGDDVPGRVGHRAQGGPQLAHRVAAVVLPLHHHRRRVRRQRTDAGPLGGDDEHLGRPRLAEAGDGAGPAGGRSADDDHLAGADEVAERSVPPVHRRTLWPADR